MCIYIGPAISTGTNAAEEGESYLDLPNLTGSGFRLGPVGFLRPKGAAGNCLRTAARAKKNTATGFHGKKLGMTFLPYKAF